MTGRDPSGLAATGAVTEAVTAGCGAGETAPSAPGPFAAARAVADAVLYEGYVLYPYRASARKNQVRWQFGVLAPRPWADAGGGDRSSMRTEVLLRPGPGPGPEPSVRVRLRCLQVQRREVQALTADGRFVDADRLEAGDTVHLPWDEAVERTVDVAPAAPASPDREVTFRLPAGREAETVRSPDGSVAGRVVRRREAVDGRLHVSVTAAAGQGPGLSRVTVIADNVTERSRPGAPRDEVLPRALVATHIVLAAEGGRFVSLLDPPQDAAGAAAACDNDGTFPVLIGEGDDVVLSSPIILYDHPEVAAESPGDLYDATEIDEILALRVLTLTDEEKAEARATDPRAAAVVDRCDDMPPELWARLHGAVRSLGPVPDPAGDGTGDGPGGQAGADDVPWWDPGADASVDPWTDRVRVGGVDVARGTTVRLRPSRRADAHDLFLTGRTATVAGVFRDVDGREHVAVTLASDPAAEAFAWQGRFLYFDPDEVEPVTGGGGAP